MNNCFHPFFRRRLCALVVACLAFSGAGADLKWRTGLHAGALLAASELERSGGIGPGAHLAYNFTDIYSLELAVSGYSAERKRDAARLDLTTVVMTGRVHFSPLTDSAVMYAGGGLGLYAVDNRDDDAQLMRARVHAALGFEYYLNPRWELFADYRFTFLHLLQRDGFNHGMLRAGFNYLF